MAAISRRDGRRNREVSERGSAPGWGRFSDRGADYLFFRLCRFALSRLRYLCLLIFFRRFLISEPIQVDLCVLRADVPVRNSVSGPH